MAATSARLDSHGKNLHRHYSSSEDTDSKNADDLLPESAKDPRLMFGKNFVRVCRVSVNAADSSTKLIVKYLYRPNKESDFSRFKSFNNSGHVKIVRLPRSHLPTINHNAPATALNLKSREKNTTNINNQRLSKKLPENMNGNVINREIQHVTSEYIPAQINRILTAAHKNQSSNQKAIASKPIVTKLPPIANQNKPNMAVKNIVVQDKDS